MNNLIDSIVTEWAYRVNDGMPNPKNQYHLVHLKESMKSLKVDGDVINMVMNRLYGKRVITEGATNRTEDLHEIFFAIAFAGGDISKAKDLNGLKQVVNNILKGADVPLLGE